MSKNIPFLTFLLLFITQIYGNSQTIDSNYIFNSPRKLVNAKSADVENKFAFGANALITESGFGGGLFYDYKINKTLAIQIDLPLTYLRASDEFEEYIPNADSTAYIMGVKNKINRLFRMPFTIGVRYNLFTKSLGEGFKPYLTAGGGLGFIYALPYKYTFFQSFNYTTVYVKPAMYFGVGADFSGKSNRVSRVFFKYYYIPFGGDGIESIKNMPISNCGGLFLGLDFGLAW